MRPWVAGVLLLAGCLQAAPGDEGPSAPQADAAAAAPDPAAANVTALPEPPAPATLADVGASWSQCHVRSSVLLYRHEWAAKLVPEEYRQVNVIAGNFGEANFKFLQCGGIAIGNRTFLPETQWALFAVQVAPPAGIAGPWPNVYLLDLVTDAPEFMAQLAEARLPSLLGELRLGEQDFQAVGVEGAARPFEAKVTEAYAEPAGYNATEYVRLHWKAAHGFCWVDLEQVYVRSEETDLQFEGKAGHPAALAGPAGVLTGAGARGTEDGRMTAPTCRAVAG